MCRGPGIKELEPEERALLAVLAVYNAGRRSYHSVPGAKIRILRYSLLAELSAAV